MNDTQLLERLSSAYATVPAPAPSAALSALMDAGGVSDDQPHDGVVVPFPRPHTRMRMRYLVAATVATFMLFSGLAVAGALPDPLQRQVSSVVSHLGIDLPRPSDDHGGSGPQHGPDREAPSSRAPGTSAGGGAAVTPGSTAGADGSAPGNADGSTSVTPPATLPGGSVLGGVGDILGGATPTTLPPSDGSGGLLPPLTVPEVTLPPLTVAPLPPLTVPQLPLPVPTLPLGF